MSGKYAFFKVARAANNKKYEDIEWKTENGVYKHVSDGEMDQENEVLEGENANLDASSLTVVKTQKPIAKFFGYGKDGAMMVNFRWENAMKDIPNPVISKNFGQ